MTTASNTPASGSDRQPDHEDQLTHARQVHAEWLKLRPGFIQAIARDAIRFAVHRGDAVALDSTWERRRYQVRLFFSNGMYFGLVLYRLRTVLRDRGVPLLPGLLSIFCSVLLGIRIGDAVVMKAGVYIPHGQILIDGVVLIGSRSVLCPWITIGVREGDFLGPELQDDVFVGTGAKVLGAIQVGEGSSIGANAVVIGDVPPHATAVGVPATIVPKAD